MTKILIQDFLAEANKICDDASTQIMKYQKARYPHKRCEYTKYLILDDAMLIADKLIADSEANDFDIQSFTRGIHDALHKNKIKYDQGIMYANINYLGGR